MGLQGANNLDQQLRGRSTSQQQKLLAEQVRKLAEGQDAMRMLNKNPQMLTHQGRNQSLDASFNKRISPISDMTQGDNLGPGKQKNQTNDNINLQLIGKLMKNEQLQGLPPDHLNDYIQRELAKHKRSEQQQRMNSVKKNNQQISGENKNTIPMELFKHFSGISGFDPTIQSNLKGSNASTSSNGQTKSKKMGKKALAQQQKQQEEAALARQQLMQLQQQQYLLGQYENMKPEDQDLQF